MALESEYRDECELNKDYEFYKINICIINYFTISIFDIYEASWVYPF